MADLTAQRTLVKSPPELWEELSEVERLAKHLDAFGEIKITKLDPEHTVAWEGEHASGTVSIEPSGWGTKVVLRAELAGHPEQAVEADPVNGGEADAEGPADPDASDEPDGPIDGGPHEPVEAEPATVVPASEASEDPPRRPRIWSRLGRWLRGDDWRHVPAEESPQAAPMTPALAAPAATAATLETTTVEPIVEEPKAEVEVEVEAASEDGDDSADASPAAMDAEHAQAVLDHTLDTLGSAHHRPFSRG